MGRLTRDPDIRYSDDEKKSSVVRFTLAVDRMYSKNARDGATADFISCVSFGKTADVIGKYCSKGTKITVSGRIQTGSYTNRDGNKVYTTDVIVSDMEFAESKKAASGAPSSPDYKKESVSDDGFMKIPDDIEKDLPFA